jgi:hypothetical protein
MLAGFHGPDAAQGVPVIGRGKADGIDVLGLEQLSHIAVTADRLAGRFLKLTGAVVQDRFVHIAKRHNLDARLLAKSFNVVFATTTDTHDSDPNGVACSHGLPSTGETCGDRCGRGAL